MSITYQESVRIVSRITLEKNKMTYIYDHSKGTIISDEKPELKDKKTRKPGAVPPKYLPFHSYQFLIPCIPFYQ